jgi:hypothetical protein
MTINTDQTLALLKASVEREAMKKEIAVLKATVAARDERIAALEAQARRTALPFRRDQTRALSPQGG